MYMPAECYLQLIMLSMLSLKYEIESFMHIFQYLLHVCMLFNIIDSVLNEYYSYAYAILFYIYTILMNSNIFAMMRVFILI